MKCTYCPQEVTDGHKTCAYHVAYFKAYKRKWFKLHPLKLKAHRAQTKDWQERQRQAVFDHYGSKCVCCGEATKGFLSLDHIHNDGFKHRKELGKWAMGLNFYRWLIRNKFPENIVQVLCMNCNHGKSRHGGICPHKLAA